MAINVNFPENGGAVLFPKDGETLILPSGAYLSGDTKIKISGSDFTLEFPDGKSLTLLFGGVFTSIGNNLNIQDGRGTKLDLNNLIANYETTIANNVLLQSIDAMSLNELLEKIPEDQQGQEIAEGNAEDGKDGTATGRAGKSENNQDEKDYKLTIDRETDDSVEEVTGSGSSELGGDDDLVEQVNVSDNVEEKTEDFEQILNQYTSFATAESIQDFSEVEEVAPQTAGSVSDAEALLQTTIQLASESDTGSSNSDSITKDSSFNLTGESTAGAVVRIYKTTYDPANPAESLIGTVTVEETGNNAQEGMGTWSIAIDASADEDGTYTYYAVPVSQEGNGGFGIPARTEVTIDTQPDLVTVELHSDSVGRFSTTHTSDSNFKLSGSAAAGSKIIVIVNGLRDEANPTVVAQNGIWEYQATQPFVNGIVSIAVEQTDIAGNIRTTDTLNVTLNSSRPETPVINSITSNREGAQSGAGFVGDDTPVVTGSGSANNYIEIFVDNQSVGIFQITNQDGTWTYEVTKAIEEGSHIFHAVQYSQAGLDSIASANISAVVSNPTTNLTIGIENSTDSGVKGDNYTNVASGIVLEGTGARDEQLEILSVSDGVRTNLGTVEVNTSGIWQLTLPQTISNGSSEFIVSRVATGEEESFILTVDTVVKTPILTIDNAVQVNGSYYIKAPIAANLNLQTEPFATVQINSSLTSVNRTANADGAIVVALEDLSLNVSGTNQSNLVSFQVVDRAGNNISFEATLIVNPSPINSVSASLSASDQTGGIENLTFTKNSDVTIVGETNANASVSLYQVVGNSDLLIATITADSSGNFSLPASLTALTDGEHLVRVVASNVTGQSQETTLQFTVDTVAPPQPTIFAPGSANNAAATNEATPTISGSGSAFGDEIRIFNAGVLIDTASAIKADANGNWEATINGLVEGSNNITATATDRSGNVSDLSNVFRLTLDTMIETPTIKLADSSKGLFDNQATNVPNFVLEGTAEANSSIRITIAGNNQNYSIENISVNENGNWTTTNQFSLLSGEYVIVATVTDAAGNTAPSPNFAVTLDTIPPSIPSNIAIENINDAQEINDDTPTITGTGESGVYIEVTAVTLNNKVYAPVMIDSAGNWQFESPDQYSGGSNQVSIRAIDAAGNSSSPTLFNFTVTVPNLVGKLSIQLAQESDTGTLGDSTTNRDIVTLEGTGPANETLRLYGENDTFLQSVTVDVLGNWSVNNISLNAGHQTFYIVRGASLPSLASSGNVESRSIALDDAVAASAVSFNHISSNEVAGKDSAGAFHINSLNNYEIAITTEAFATVAIFIGSNQVVQTTANNLGEVTINLSDTNINSSIVANDTGNTFTVNFADTAGNTTSITETLIYDTTVPIAPETELLADFITGTSNLHTNNDNFTVEGDTDPGINVRVEFTIVSRDGTALTVAEQNQLTAAVNTTSNGSGSFQVALPALLVPIAGAGETVEVRVTTTATDIAGNVNTFTQTFTADRSPPTTPSLDLHTNSDTRHPEDNITKNTPVTVQNIVSETAEVGAIVTLYLDGSKIDFVNPIEVNGSGEWSAILNLGSDGVHNITATLTDKAGNVSSLSSPLAITLDTGIVAPTIALAAEDQGRFDVSQTPNTDFTLEGTTEANSTLIVTYSSSSLANDVTVTIPDTDTGTGTWSLEAPAAVQAVANGVFNISLINTDVAGNIINTNDALVITVDTILPITPSLNVSTAALGFADGNMPHITGTGTAGDRVVINITGNSSLNNSFSFKSDPFVIPTGGNWSLSADFYANNNLENGLPDGDYTFSAVTIDIAGNESTGNPSEDLTVDTAAPTVTASFVGSSEQALPSNQNEISLEGTVTGASGEVGSFLVRINVDGTEVATVPLATFGPWTYDLDVSAFAEGDYVIQAFAVDSAANVSEGSTTLTLTRDTVTPDITVGLHPNNISYLSNQLNIDDATSSDQPTLRGITEADASVVMTITGNDSGNSYSYTATVTADSSGAWAATIPSASGLTTEDTYSVSVEATDAAGNTNTNSIEFDFDGTADTVADNFVLGTYDSTSNIVTPTFTGTAVAGTYVLAVLGTNFDTDGPNTFVGTTQVGAGGNWSLTTEILPAGGQDSNILFINTDAAGNQHTTNRSALVTIDQTPVTVNPGTVSLDSSDITNTVDGIDYANTNSGVVLSGNISTTLGSSLGLYLVIDSGVPVQLTPNGSGDWTTNLGSVDLTDGTHSVQIYVENQFAERSNPTNYSYIIDTAPPSAPSLSFSSATTISNGVTKDSIIIEGTSEASATVTLSYQLGTNSYVDYPIITTTDSNGNWSITTTGLADGDYNFRATATDLAQNTSANSSSITVELDTQVDFSYSSNTLFTMDTTPTLTGTTEAGATLSLTIGSNPNPYTTTAVSDGSWSINVNNTLAVTNHSISMQVTDQIGNVETFSDNLAVDQANPTISSLSVTNATNSGGVWQAAANSTITGTTEAFSTVTLTYSSNNYQLVATADASGNFSFTPFISSTQQTVTIEAEDRAGNTSISSLDFVLASGPKIINLADNYFESEETDTEAEQEIDTAAEYAINHDTDAVHLAHTESEVL